ncbi:MAG: HNH endonuclease [Thomasclavelia sp.]|jgi:hypothetical protein|nr:HNH endonuclease [Thomasclavelia sp.]
MDIKSKTENFNQPKNTFSEGFSPDVRNKKEDQTENLNSKEKYNVDNKLDGFNSTRKERIESTPNETNPNGHWEGARGEGKFVVTNEEAKEALSKFGLDGIPYKYGIPNFTPVSKGTVKIDNMSGIRADNFKKGYEAMAEKWNEEKHEGQTNWDAQKVKQYKIDNKLDFHECADGKTMQFVDHSIHIVCGHRGGRSEAAIKQGDNKYDK